MKKLIIVDESESNQYALINDEVCCVIEVEECDIEGCTNEPKCISFLDDSHICEICYEIELDNLSDEDYEEIFG